MKPIEDATVYLCCDCSDKFSVTDSEAQWFTERGLTLPKRCKFCRESRKARYASR